MPMPQSNIKYSIIMNEILYLMYILVILKNGNLIKLKSCFFFLYLIYQNAIMMNLRLFDRYTSPDCSGKNLFKIYFMDFKFHDFNGSIFGICILWRLLDDELMYINIGTANILLKYIQKNDMFSTTHFMSFSHPHRSAFIIFSWQL